MERIFFESLSGLSEKIAKKELSPCDIVDQVLNRIGDLNPTVNAYITVMKSEAKLQAEILEKELLGGKRRGPLHGIPIAVKDNLETVNTLTTAGSKIFNKWIPDKDAEVVSKLKKAGAIIIGKTNLHEFAIGATTENPHFGSTRNPWDLERIPGGSSGGSAVAVATGMSWGALGTDTAGSIRLPAAICGVVGMKPTYDLVSRIGCIPLSWSLDHIGPLTRNVKDTEIMLRTIIEEASLSFLTSKSLESLNGIKIGLIQGYFDDMNPEMNSIVKKFIGKMESNGAEIVEVEFPDLILLHETQKMISKSEAFTYHKPLFEEFPDYYGEDLQFRLRTGGDIAAHQYIDAMRMRNVLIQKGTDIFNTCDIIVNPTNIIPPYKIGEVSAEKSIENIYKLGRTPMANLLGFPAISIPCGKTSENFPVGIQFMGKPYTDSFIMDVASYCENFENWEEELKTNLAYKPFKESLA